MGRGRPPYRRIEPLRSKKRLAGAVGLRRLSASGATTASTAPNWATKFQPSHCYFFKPPSSLLATGGTILRPRVSEPPITRANSASSSPSAHKLPADEIPALYSRYTCVNDFTPAISKIKTAMDACQGLRHFFARRPGRCRWLDPWGIQVETRATAKAPVGHTNILFSR